MGIPLINRLSAKKTNPSLVLQSRPIWYYDIGFWIGLFEILIIFSFVLNKEFSALAIIFGAKEFVRKDEIKVDPAYYLLGTLINFGVALIFVQFAKEALIFFAS